MAFSNYSHELSEAMDIKDALKALHSYVDGMERAYVAEEALAYLETKYKAEPIARFRAAMESEEDRQELCGECLKDIERVIEKTGGVWGAYRSR